MNPEDGVSAITVASRAVSRMPLGRIDKETTANISRFEGGVTGATNIVVERVRLEGEARSITDEKMHAQVQRMREACEQVCGGDGGTARFSKRSVLSRLYVR
ncbi:peptidase dimerization domain-containing protein [Paenibacillus sp. P25]|nr:peptidase dimerization domain-containing protein [Paenibacillus sp. P25]